jgi:FemAB-related protein (PEP-CTERM system-associated)
VVAWADSETWDEFVSACPDATGYHLWAWRRVFENVFAHRTHYLAAQRDDRIVGVLPLVELRSRLFGNFMVSLPFVNYGGVLAADATTAAALVDHATRVAEERGLSHVELRHLSQRFPGTPCKRHKVTMLLPLDASPDGMWKGLDRKVRNQVRKAEKNALTCEIGGQTLVDDFYPVFASNMRDLGTPVYSKRFFAEVLSVFPDAAKVFVVRKDRRPIAAGIGYVYRDRFEMPWASSLRALHEFCPNNLLYWTAIRHAAVTGCKIFDFGRSTPNEGTYHFKAQWGAVAQPLCWEYCLIGHASIPDQSPKNAKYALAIRMWKRLPVSIASVLGPPIVRGIP